MQCVERIFFYFSWQNHYIAGAATPFDVTLWWLILQKNHKKNTFQALKQQSYTKYDNKLFLP